MGPAWARRGARIGRLAAIRGQTGVPPPALLDAVAAVGRR
ncbi:hypothetical protein HD597_002831 [Nonomuraea thailandensis]|uniref:Uncharacterized protein n=1 Tax=Nonomuraea thailandensis TaxID=1188745 RepID=A0A9X2K3Q2_9ACTN|nr:hypothetical protein [Nonomuraea thailandensis]